MDEAILQSIRGIVDVLLNPGRMSLDLADMRTLLKGAGQATVAVGFGKGDSRVEDVTRGLQEYPFAQNGRMTAARSLLISISGGPDLGMREVNTLESEIGKLVEGEPKLGTGIHTHESMQGEIRCMIMAAGLTTPAEPESKDFPLFGDHDPSIAVYRPQGWARPGARPAGERDPQPAREDNVEVPAYLRKGKSTPAPGGRG
jgi:cell division protein FtsZ